MRKVKLLRAGWGQCELSSLVERVGRKSAEGHSSVVVDSGRRLNVVLFS